MLQQVPTKVKVTTKSQAPLCIIKQLLNQKDVLAVTVYNFKSNNSNLGLTNYELMDAKLISMWYKELADLVKSILMTVEGGEKHDKLLAKLINFGPRVHMQMLLASSVNNNYL